MTRLVQVRTTSILVSGDWLSTVADLPPPGTRRVLNHDPN